MSRGEGGSGGGGGGAAALAHGGAGPPARPPDPTQPPPPTPPDPYFKEAARRRARGIVARTCPTKILTGSKVGPRLRSMPCPWLPWSSPMASLLVSVRCRASAPAGRRRAASLSAARHPPREREQRRAGASRGLAGAAEFFRKPRVRAVPRGAEGLRLACSPRPEAILLRLSMRELAPPEREPSRGRPREPLTGVRRWNRRSPLAFGDVLCTATTRTRWRRSIGTKRGMGGFAGHSRSEWWRGRWATSG